MSAGAASCGRLPAALGVSAAQAGVRSRSRPAARMAASSWRRSVGVSSVSAFAKAAVDESVVCMGTLLAPACALQADRDYAHDDLGLASGTPSGGIRLVSISYLPRGSSKRR